METVKCKCGHELGKRRNTRLLHVSNQELADKGQWVCGCETPED